MNQGVVQSSPVQQIVAAGGPNSWWYINNMRPPPHGPHHQHHSFLAAAPPAAHHDQLPTSALFSAASASSWNDTHQLPAESWSQLLLGGLVGEDQDKPAGNFEAKRLENITWDQQQLILNQSNSTTHLDIKKEKHTNYDGKHPHQDLSPECNSTGTGGTAKKARIQPCSAQSSFKVRKEKLGDRITALHQIVSPFGKTDTASVLLEAIGYIRFLQNQIEALSLPYLGGGSGISTRQQHPPDQGDQRNCLFPEDPGQLLNENCIKRKGISDLQESDEEDSRKDLRSRGLCLVPISCTLHVGSENIGADYWAPAFGTANFR